MSLMQCTKRTSSWKVVASAMVGGLCVSCGPPQPELAICDEVPNLAFVVAMSDPGFPDPPEVEYWVGVEKDASPEDLEVMKFWQASDGRVPVGVAVSADLSSIHILHGDALVIVTDADSDHEGDIVDEIPLGATALAGPVVNGTDAAFLVATPGIELWAYDAQNGQLQPQWRAEGSLGSGALALATAGARDTYLISEPEAGVIWRLDALEGTLESFYSAASEELPSRSMSYRQASGLAWIPGAEEYGASVKLAVDTDRDGQITDTDMDMILFEDDHCAMPINAGIGQVGGSVVWSNYGCGDSVFILTPENVQTNVTPSGDLPIAIAAAPDPCQRTRDP